MWVKKSHWTRNDHLESQQGRLDCQCINFFLPLMQFLLYHTDRCGRDLTKERNAKELHDLKSSPYFALVLFCTSWHRAEVLNTLLKRSTPPCGQTNKTNHHCQTTPDLDRGLACHAPPKGQARKKVQTA